MTPLSPYGLTAASHLRDKNISQMLGCFHEENPMMVLNLTASQAENHSHIATPPPIWNRFKSPSTRL